jgi:hypothetical protein
MKMTDKVYGLVSKGMPFRDAYTEIKNTDDLSNFLDSDYANSSEGSPGNLNLKFLENRLKKQE